MLIFGYCVGPWDPLKTIFFLKQRVEIIIILYNLQIPLVIGSASLLYVYIQHICQLQLTDHYTLTHVKNDVYIITGKSSSSSQDGVMKNR